MLGFNDPPEHYQLLSSFIKDATVVDLTENIVDSTIDIRKKYKTKLPDAIIAATAIVHNMILITRNITDFKIVKNLQVVDPHNIF
jgi:predicted nucleic acid-binding protein